MNNRYTLRIEPLVEDGDDLGNVCHLDFQGREVAHFTGDEPEQDAAHVLEAVNRYWDVLNAMKDLVFEVGKLPEDGSGTVQGQELNRAYRKASDLLREKHEERISESEAEHG